LGYKESNRTSGKRLITDQEPEAYKKTKVMAIGGTRNTSGRENDNKSH